MCGKYFTIRNFPDDIYNAVGQIIKNAQEWEQRCKELTSMLDVHVKKISKSSLNKLHDALKKQKMISDKEYDDLKKVIKLRNYINHEFYLTDFQNANDDYDSRIEALEKILNNIQFLIFEAIDVVDNKIDKLHGVGFVRPTVFD